METRSSLVARLVVGVLLVLESIVMQVMGAYAAMIGGLMALLSIGISKGSVADELLTESTVVTVLKLASPFVIGAALGVGGIFLLIRRGRRVIVTAGCIAMAAQVPLHLFVGNGIHPAEVVLFAVHFLAIAVGFAFVPAAPGTNVAAT